MQNSKVLGGILLIAGTTVGAGMLALPVVTGSLGFWPAVGVIVFCWLLLLWTAFLFVEVTLCFDHEVNLIQMAKATLGQWSAPFVWVIYLLLFYSLLAAYLSGGGPMVVDFVNGAFDVNVPSYVGVCFLSLVLAPLIYFGLTVVDGVNRYLMGGLILFYLMMVAVLLPKIDLALLSHANPVHVFGSMSVLITAFGFHQIIPSITNYLGRDAKKTKWCIFWGSAIPLVVYLIWEFLILATLPAEGPNSIAEILASNEPIARALMLRLESRYIGAISGTFSLLAIVTSFLGVAVALFDFLRDGLRVKNNVAGRLAVLAAAFLPPLIFALGFKSGFVLALQYAGIFVAILLGLLPIAMTWASRYRRAMHTPYRVMGGRALLAIGFIVWVFVIILEIK